MTMFLHRHDSMTPCDPESREFFGRPEVRAVALACLEVFRNRAVCHDPKPWYKPLQGGAVCPKVIAAFVTSQLKIHFSQESILVV